MQSDNMEWSPLMMASFTAGSEVVRELLLELAVPDVTSDRLSAVLSAVVLHVMLRRQNFCWSVVLMLICNKMVYLPYYWQVFLIGQDGAVKVLLEYGASDSISALVIASTIVSIDIPGVVEWFEDCELSPLVGI